MRRGPMKLWSAWPSPTVPDPTPEAYRGALRTALEGAGDAIVERFVAGREISVGIIDGVVLGTCEIEPDEHVEFYNYEAKYERGDTTYRVPPDLPADVIAEAERHAAAIYGLLGARGVSRVDFIVDEAGVPWLLELNTVLAMTATSLVPKIAAARGIEFPELCEWLLDLAV